MTYELPTKFYFFVKDLVLIRKGVHPHFKGDRLYNSEAVCFDFGRKYPEYAEIFCERLLKEAKFIDLPEASINILVKYLRKGVYYK